jgi:hypothetical protein
MRLVLLALLLPLAACATPPAPVQTAALDGEPKKAEPAKVCWTEKVTGTLGRRQTVCRDERSEDEADLMRKNFKDFQDRASGTQGQTIPLGGGG